MHYYITETWGLRLPDGRILRQGISERPLTSSRDVRSDFAPELVESGEVVRLTRTVHTEFLTHDDPAAPLDTPVEVKRGMRFLHARFIDGSPKAGTAKPVEMIITRVTRDSVYYRRIDAESGTGWVIDAAKLHTIVKEWAL